MPAVRRCAKSLTDGSSQNGSGFLPAEALFEPCQATRSSPRCQQSSTRSPLSGWRAGKSTSPRSRSFHLHAGRLELSNEKPDLVRNRLDGALDLLHASRIRPAAVPGDLSLELSEAASVCDEASARSDEPFDERRNDAQRIVRLLLAEEPHTC